MRHPGVVRIVRGDVELFAVVVYLTRAEAAELRDAAEAVLSEFDVPGYHAHISSNDYQTEITLAPDVRPT